MESTSRFENKLNQFNQILTNFSLSINLSLENRDAIELDLLRNGQIQKFEYALEAFWKLAKSYLIDIHGVDCSSPKSCIKLLFQNTEMDESDYELLIYMINCRNNLSHIYDEESFNKIYSELINFELGFKRVLSVLN